MVVILFGMLAGQAVTAHTTQVYVLLYLQRVLSVPPDVAYRAVAIALLLLVPLFPLVGSLSDRIGRKRTMLAGHVVAIPLPYNLGNGWFGGFLPLIATALVTATGDRLAWLGYPIALSALAILIGLRFVTDAPREAVSPAAR